VPAPHDSEDAPDMRHPESRQASQAKEPAPLVRASLPEAEGAGLDIPAFLRRQSS
jgi:hypothetical protein